MNGSFLITGRSMQSRFFTACLALLSLTLLSTSQAATLTVCSADYPQSCDHTQLQSAITAASNGDTIKVLGVITESGIVVNKNLTITTGTDLLEPSIIQAHPVKGEATDRVLRVTAGTVATLEDLVIRHGVISGSFGGGIANLGDLTLIRVVVEHNTSDTSGGGIFNGVEAKMTILDSTIRYNDATSSGGGIINDSPLTELIVKRSNFSFNTSFEGGAIRNRANAFATIENSTFFANTGTNGGGAIFNSAGTATVVIDSSTFHRNSLRAIQSNGSAGSIQLLNSILAGSGPAPDFNGDDCAVFSNGVITDGGHNLIENGGNCVFGAASTTVGVSAGLQPPANWGGHSRAVAPFDTSLAINTGSTSLTTDQRNVSRPQDSADDVGAVELRNFDVVVPQTFIYPVTLGTTNTFAVFEVVDNLSPNFEVLTHDAVGQDGVDQFNPATLTSNYFDTYIGVLPAFPEATAVAVRFHATGEVYWRVIMGDGKEWFFEGGDIQTDTGLEVLPTEWPPVVPGEGGAGDDVYSAEVGVDIPNSLFLSRYSSNVDQAVAMVAYTLMNTNSVFLRQMGIQHRLGRLIIRQNVGVDPYDGASSTGDHFNELRTQWFDTLPPILGANTADLVTVACTGCSGLASTGVGSSNPGPSANGSTGKGDFSGFFTHEVGHNWSLVHQAGDSPEGNTVMSGNDLLRFSPTNQVLGTLYRNQQKQLLTNLGHFEAPIKPWAGTDRIHFNSLDSDAVIDVLANDHDANGDELKLVGIDPISLQPLGGILVIAPNAGAGGRDALRYIPPAFVSSAELLVDRFTYTIEDSTGRRALGNVFVRLVNFAGSANFSQDFDGFADGTTLLDDGSWIGRYYWNNDSTVQNLPQVDSGMLTLILDGTSSNSVGAYTLPNLDLQNGFKLSFKMRMFPSSASTPQGIQVNFGDPEVLKSRPINGVSFPARFKEGVSFKIDNRDSDMGFSLLTTTPAADGMNYADETIIAEDDNNGEDFVDESFHDVTFIWDPVYGFSMKYDGELIFNRVVINGYTPDSEDMLSIIGVAIGGASSEIVIDDVVLTDDLPPENDDYPNATSVTSSNFSTTDSLVNATVDGAVIDSTNPDVTNPDVWYSIPSQSVESLVEISTCGTNALYGLDTTLSVHTDDGQTGSVDNLLDKNDDYASGSFSTACVDEPSGRDSAVSITVQPNEPLLVRVSEFEGPEAQFNLTINITPVPQPPFNDDFVDAFVITTNPTTIIATLVNATVDGVTAPTNPDVWYKLGGQPVPSTVSISTCRTNAVFGLDSHLTVFADEGTVGTSANQLDINDDYDSGSDPTACIDEPTVRDSAVKLTVGPNEPLLIRVSEFQGPEAAFFLNVNVEAILVDTDGDGITDDVDNCTADFNPSQLDTNGDGIGNRCDADINNDCLINFADFVPYTSAFGSVDGDANFNPDVDADGTGIINFFDILEFSQNFLMTPGPSASGCDAT